MDIQIGHGSKSFDKVLKKLTHDFYFAKFLQPPFCCHLACPWLEQPSQKPHCRQYRKRNIDHPELHEFQGLKKFSNFLFSNIISQDNCPWHHHIQLSMIDLKHLQMKHFRS